MSVVCDFDIDLRIIAADGSTVVYSFQSEPDRWVVSIQEPEETEKVLRTDAPLVDGDAPYASALAPGDLLATVRFTGATWGAVETQYQAARTAWRAEPAYYVEVVREGVTKRYRTERPDSVVPDEPDLKNRRQAYSIRWHVQPSPSVSIA